MKICFLADAGSVHTKKWCRYFSQEYEISVISLRSGEIEGVKVYSLDTDRSSRGTLAKLAYLKKIFTVRKLVKSINPDILHAHYATSYGLLGRMSGFHPLLISVWGSDIFEFPFKSAFHKAFLKWNLKGADHLLSTSSAMADEANKYTKTPFMLTPFGVDTDIFKPLENKKSGFTVGIVKSLRPIYGIEYLIKGFALFLRQNGGADASLRITGSGEEEGKLKVLTKELNIWDRVVFNGFISGDEELAKEYNNLDVAVFPSLSESFGVAAVEAMSCGVCTVVSQAQGLREIVDDGGYGIVVPIKDEVSIAKTINLLYHNDELCKEYSQKGRERALDSYSLSDTFNVVADLYRSIKKRGPQK